MSDHHIAIREIYAPVGIFLLLSLFSGTEKESAKEISSPPITTIPRMDGYRRFESSGELMPARARMDDYRRINQPRPIIPISKDVPSIPKVVYDKPTVHHSHYTAGVVNLPRQEMAGFAIRKEAAVPQIKLDDRKDAEPECSEKSASLPVEIVPRINGYRGQWIRQPEPIIQISENTDRFDFGYTSTPNVVYDVITDSYHTYYTGGVIEDRPGREMIGVALSKEAAGPRIKLNAGGDRGSLFSLGEFGHYDHDRQWGMGTIFPGNPWRMWTIGDSDSTERHIARVGYAESADGITWTKLYARTTTGAVFEQPAECRAEQFFRTNGVLGILNFSVLREDNGFYAWYYTFDSNSIRLAFSEDGINDWRTLGAINLPIAVTGLGNVMKDGSIYYLTATKPDFTSIVVFVSTDKANWVLYDELGLSGASAWQTAWMGYPFLMKDIKGTWHLFYTAADKNDSGLSGRIGMATLHQ